MKLNFRIVIIILLALFLMIAFGYEYENSSEGSDSNNSSQLVNNYLYTRKTIAITYLDGYGSC